MTVPLLGIEFPPVSHLVNWPDIAFEDSVFAINKVTLIFLASTFITLAIFFLAGRKAKLVPTGVQNVAESSVDFIKDGIIMQTIGAEGMGYLPFLLSMFFFIFFINIFEIVPFVQMPGNARIAVPLLLAIVVWVMFIVVGIKRQGPLKYLKGVCFPPGVPWPIYILVTPIEFVSTFLVRPLSLSVRLFANMLAGHLILVTFATLCASLYTKQIIAVILPFPFLLLIALTGFEILVSGLQAFIFTILTAVYVDSSMHAEH